MSDPTTPRERLDQTLPVEVLRRADEAYLDALVEGRSQEENNINGYAAQRSVLVDALLAAQPEPRWTCFHCDEAFTDEAEAREHFGDAEDKTPACRLSIDDVKQLRELEADNAEVRRENERLENDSRLWHESEADRVRRIGHCAWWQELDSKQGEILALQARLAAQPEPGTWQPVETHDGSAGEVLIAWPSGMVRSAHRDDHWSGGPCWTTSSGMYFDGSSGPTHWMPLPDPPQEPRS